MLDLEGTHFLRIQRLLWISRALTNTVTFSSQKSIVAFIDGDGNEDSVSTNGEWNVHQNHLDFKPDNLVVDGNLPENHRLECRYASRGRGRCGRWPMRYGGLDGARDGGKVDVQPDQGRPVVNRASPPRTNSEKKMRF